MGLSQTLADLACKAMCFNRPEGVWYVTCKSRWSFTLDLTALAVVFTEETLQAVFIHINQLYNIANVLSAAILLIEVIIGKYPLLENHLERGTLRRRQQSHFVLCVLPPPDRTKSYHLESTHKQIPN